MKNNIEKTGIILSILLAIPHFRAERESVRKQVSVIVAKYVPQIQSDLKDYVDLWREASKKSAEQSRVPYRLYDEAHKEFEKAFKRELAAWDNAHRLAKEMMEKVSAVPHFDRYYSINNPATMIKHYYEFGPCTKEAVSYCADLIKVFGS